MLRLSEAHLTVVFAALAISRHLQDRTGVSISRLVRTLRAVRSATIRVNGHEITLVAEIPPAAQAILNRIAAEAHYSSVMTQVRTRHGPAARCAEPAGVQIWTVALLAFTRIDFSSCRLTAWHHRRGATRRLPWLCR